jgi:hypothetical protein
MSIILPAEALARASDSQLVTLASAIETELPHQRLGSGRPTHRCRQRGRDHQAGPGQHPDRLRQRHHGTGQLRLRVRCQTSSVFAANADLLRIVYDRS